MGCIKLDWRTTWMTSQQSSEAIEGTSNFPCKATQIAILQYSERSLAIGSRHLVLHQSNVIAPWTTAKVFASWYHTHLWYGRCQVSFGFCNAIESTGPEPSVLDSYPWWSFSFLLPIPFSLHNSTGIHIFRQYNTGIGQDDWSQYQESRAWTSSMEVLSDLEDTLRSWLRPSQGSCQSRSSAKTFGGCYASRQEVLMLMIAVHLEFFM